jgi:hypothetical protein
MRSFIICMARQGGWDRQACITHNEKRNAYRILVGKPEGKRPLGRPRRKWEVR